MDLKLASNPEFTLECRSDGNLRKVNPRAFETKSAENSFLVWFQL